MCAIRDVNFDVPRDFVPDLVVLRAIDNSRSRSAGDIEVVLLVYEERRKAHLHCNRTSPSFDDNRRRVGSPV